MRIADAARAIPLALIAMTLLLPACDRDACPIHADPIDRFWTEAHPDLIPPGVALCEGSAAVLRFDFDPEPDTFGDVVVVQLLESHGWVRIKQSRRKEGRKYFLEKGPETLIVHAKTDKGRTRVTYEWSR